MRIQRIPAGIRVEGSRLGRLSTGCITARGRALRGLFSERRHDSDRFLDLSRLQRFEDGFATGARRGCEQAGELCPRVPDLECLEQGLKTRNDASQRELASRVEVLAGTGWNCEQRAPPPTFIHRLAC